MLIIYSIAAVAMLKFGVKCLPEPLGFSKRWNLQKIFRLTHLPL